ncbi:MAG: hypothetical protein LBP65_01740 [Puniceicoccales bacterium]|jgi:hypothetical protein|nr:hypothetical protein [Puniceicoccales bacterium]
MAWRSLSAPAILLLGCCVPSMLAGLSLLNSDGQPRDELLAVGRLLGLEWGTTASSINAHAQRHLLRPASLERHRMADSPYEGLWDDLQPLLAKLGMLQPVDPPPGHYDYLILLGQSIPMMRSQAEFIRRYLDSGVVSHGQLAFLCGRRPIDPTIDGPDPLTAIVADEAAAAQLLLAKYFSQNGQAMLVAVPMHPNGSRPNTRDTVRAWLAQQRPRPGSVLLVSTNPFIPYQLETVRGELAMAWPAGTYAVAACGDGVHRLANRSNRVAILLDCLARQLYTELTYRGELE